MQLKLLHINLATRIFHSNLTLIPPVETRIWLVVLRVCNWMNGWLGRLIVFLRIAYSNQQMTRQIQSNIKKFKDLNLAAKKWDRFLQFLNSEKFVVLFFVFSKFLFLVQIKIIQGKLNEESVLWRTKKLISCVTNVFRPFKTL